MDHSFHNRPSYSVFRGPLVLHHRIPCRIATSAVTKRRGSSSNPDDDDLNNIEPSIDADQITRRNLLFGSIIMAGVGINAYASQAADFTTVVNSILGAYGLPQLKATKGYMLYDDLDQPWLFEYPVSWVTRRNRMRPGLYIADYQTADKLSVESLSTDLPFNTAEFAMAVIQKLLFPTEEEIGGNSKLELPSPRSIRWEVKKIEEGVENKAQELMYIAFTSTTTTRSGYDVKRKHLAVAGVSKRKGSGDGESLVYCLGASARSDRWKQAEETLQTIVQSFKLR